MSTCRCNFYNIIFVRHVGLIANRCLFIPKCLCTLFMKQSWSVLRKGFSIGINSEKGCLGKAPLRTEKQGL